MRPRGPFTVYLCVVGSLMLCLNGCVLGPGSLRHSRTNYNRVVQKTAREELLLNLVRMRYNQSVEFLRIPSITGQYTYDAGLGAGGEFHDPGQSILKPFVNIGMQSKPTIVYAPEQEQEFNRRLLSPISGKTLDLLASKGWRFDRVLRLSIRNINDIDNATTAGGPTPKCKPDYEEFRYVADMFARLQDQSRSFEIAYEDRVTIQPKQLSDPIPIGQIAGEDVILAADKGYRFRVAPAEDAATLWTDPKESQIEVLRFSNETRYTAEFQEICRVLELNPDLLEYRIRTDTEGQLERPHSWRTGGQGPQDREELIVSTRSLKEVMYFLAQVVETPQSHINKGYARQTIDPATGCPFDWKDILGDLFQVHYGKLPPRNAAVSVQHRGHWFYIDETDFDSKATFNLLLELFNLEIRAGGGAQIPLLTI